MEFSFPRFLVLLFLCGKQLVINVSQKNLYKFRNLRKRFVLLEIKFIIQVQETKIFPTFVLECARSLMERRLTSNQEIVGSIPTGREFNFYPIK